MIAKAFCTALFSLLFAQDILSQTNDPDFLRSTGKIYVVVGVLVLIFIGIAGYLIYLDRKISKLENATRNEHQAEQTA